MQKESSVNRHGRRESTDENESPREVRACNQMQED